MALTRKFLTALGIEADKVEEIISQHVETVDAIKAERDDYKTKAEKYDATAQELEDLKAKADANNGDEWQTKYNTLNDEYTKYKDDVAKDKVKLSKTTAYKKLLKEAGVIDKHIDSVIKVTDFDNDKYELNDDGTFKNVEDINKAITDDWGGFIATTSEQGAQTATPPANNGGATMTIEQIRAIKNDAERQKAMLENKALFGIN